jgi:dTDP-4-amino-4,6-dideoxygalactose transaminase
MLTIQPLPTWTDLFLTNCEMPENLEEMSRSWQVVNEKVFWYSRSAFAMAAIELWWRRIHNNKLGTVWLPDYFCNQSAQPLRKAGAKLVFYPIREDLTPDWPKCRLLAKNETPDLFVLVHYFGAENDGKTASQFCRDVDAILIEDAAHVLQPFGEIGQYGDFVFYSPHKIMAVPDGAILLVKRSERTQGTEIVEFTDAPGRVVGDLGWNIKRSLQKLMPEFLLRHRNKTLPDFTLDPISYDMGYDLGPSIYSLRLLARHLPQIDQIASVRKSNAQALRYKVANKATSYYPFFDEDREGEAPYRFVLQCDGAIEAEQIYNDFRARGISVESWPDLPPEVISNPEYHRVAHNLRNSLIFLPVHQSISEANL